MNKMEVHHSHHPSHKKKWKEYFLEFFMLFIAVTMGFFAENIREHKVIEHKMKENYQSLIEDLSQDSAKVNELSRLRARNESNLVKLKYMLFQYHKKQIDWPTLQKQYKELGPIPDYVSLFINNTTFKNLQSSGLLSYIKDKTLKSRLSYYYEVMFKRLEDNNKLFDEMGSEFFKSGLPKKRIIELDRKRLDLLTAYPAEFTSQDEYSGYLLNLELTKEMLTSEKLIYDLDAYAARYYSYYNMVNSVSKKNIELIELIKSVEGVE
jgi:hypothetical protein